MRFVVTVINQRERQSRTCLSASEAVAYLCRMNAEGFRCASIVDSTYRYMSEIDLHRAAFTDGTSTR